MTPTAFLTEALPLCERAGIETEPWFAGPNWSKYVDSDPCLVYLKHATQLDADGIAWRMWVWYCEQIKDLDVIDAIWGHAPLLAAVRAELDRRDSKQTAEPLQAPGDSASGVAIGPTASKSSPTEGDPA